MSNCVVYQHICPLAYHSKCPAQLQSTQGPISVVFLMMLRCKFLRCLDAQQSSSKGPQVAAKRVYNSITQAVSSAPLQTGTQIRHSRDWHRDSPEKRNDPSHNRCIVS